MKTPEQRRLRQLRQLQALGLIAAFVGIAFVGHTTTLLLWVAAVVVACVADWNRASVWVPLWAAMALSPFVPVDVSFENRPGPPHFARLVMGLAIRKDMVAKYKTDVVMGGCVATGFEPKWVWVW